MIVETPVENPPPVIGLQIPEYARPYCDTWGNFKIEPVKTIEESHGLNFIKVMIYMVNHGYYYGYQLKINKIILQKQANIKDQPEETENSARLAARNELQNIVTEKKINDIFIMFDKICYNQPELF